MSHTSPRFLGLVLLNIVATACGSDDAQKSPPTDATSTATAPVTQAPTSTTSGPVGTQPVTPGHTDVGPTGTTGDTGSTGATGDTGSTGTTGDTGSTGDTGANTTSPGPTPSTSEPAPASSETGETSSEPASSTNTGATSDSDVTSAPSSGGGSAGCGSASPLQGGTKMVTIGGTQRQWVLDVPANYDANTEYPLIFVWHPLGGSASQVVNGGYDGLKSRANNTAIFVAADGLEGGNQQVSGKGWWNADGHDMELFTTIWDEVTSNLCIDQARVFSTGFSFGGMMSYTVGFQFDVFRAVAPTSGNLDVVPHEDNNTAPLAIMAFHGDNDTFVATSGGRAARDQYIARNHCQAETQPVDPSPCVAYQGCDVPTIWCEYPGAHSPWNQMPDAVWDFFSQFE